MATTQHTPSLLHPAELFYTAHCSCGWHGRVQNFPALCRYDYWTHLEAAQRAEAERS